MYHRYYHVFREGEIESLITAAFKDQVQIVDRYYDHANWVVKLKKL